MATKQNNVKYFLMGERPAMIWDPDTNAIAAMANPAGVFATVKKSVEEILTKRGYKPVELAVLEEYGLAVPEPDRTDHHIFDAGGKYTML